MQRLGQTYYLLSAIWWLPGLGHAFSCDAVTHREGSVIMTALVWILPCLVMDPVPPYIGWRSCLTVTWHPHLCWCRGGIIYISCLARSRACIFQLGLAFLCSVNFLELGNPMGDTQGCLHYVANVLLASWVWFGWEHSHSKAVSWLVSLLFLHLCVSGSMWLLWGTRGFLCNPSCLLWDSLLVLQGREKRWERSLGSVLTTGGLVPSEVDQDRALSLPVHCKLTKSGFKAPPNWRGLDSNTSNSPG